MRIAWQMSASAVRQRLTLQRTRQIHGAEVVRSPRERPVPISMRPPRSSLGNAVRCRVRAETGAIAPVPRGPTLGDPAAGSGD